MKRRRRKTTIGGQFAWRLVEMLESDAYRALSRDAQRVLSRLEIEMCHRGGTSNGALVVTYADFVRYGVERESVAPSIREVVALRFVEITRQGRGGNAEFRLPTTYRLTYRETDFADPTNEWRSIRTKEEAQEVARAARRAKSSTAVERSKQAAEKQKTGAGLPQVSGRQSRPENDESPGRKSRRSTPGRQSRPTIYISGRGTEQQAREARPSGSAVASGLAATERDDVVQSRIADRLGGGAGAWATLQAIPDELLAQLVESERTGALTDETIQTVRQKYLQRGAA
jgi:hypothetical protein